VSAFADALHRFFRRQVDDGVGEVGASHWTLAFERPDLAAALLDRIESHEASEDAFREHLAEALLSEAPCFADGSSCT
jgi:hypothetical protein